MTAIKRLAFGLQPPRGTAVAWGARTIYKASSDPDRVMIDILHDRQDRFGDTEQLKPLCGWIGDSLKALRVELAGRDVRGDSTETVRIEADGFVLEASPNGSHGYLYIVAYVQPAVA